MNKRLYGAPLQKEIEEMYFILDSTKGESRLKNLCIVRVLNFFIRYFSNYYTLHRSDLAARAAPLDPRLRVVKQVPVLLTPSRACNFLIL